MPWLLTSSPTTFPSAPLLPEGLFSLLLSTWTLPHNPHPQAPSWRASAPALPPSGGAQPHDTATQLSSLPQEGQLYSDSARFRELSKASPYLNSQINTIFFTPSQVSNLLFLRYVSPYHLFPLHNTFNLFFSAHFLPSLVECKLHDSEILVNFVHICIFSGVRIMSAMSSCLKNIYGIMSEWIFPTKLLWWSNAINRISQLVKHMIHYF